MNKTDPEKLRALVEKWRRETWEPYAPGHSPTLNYCADGLEAIIQEAERPTPPVEEIDYRFLYRSAEAECIRWRRRAERLGYTVEGEHKSVTPPVEDAVDWKKAWHALSHDTGMEIEKLKQEIALLQEDAVTRAKLEMLDKVKTAIIAIPEGESDPVLIWMSVHLTIDALRAHLKGSPE
jgi:hypothetical protein